MIFELDPKVKIGPLEIGKKLKEKVATEEEIILKREYDWSYAEWHRISAQVVGMDNVMLWNVWEGLWGRETAEPIGNLVGEEINRDKRTRGRIRFIPEVSNKSSL